MKIIDCHHHLWDISGGKYSWLSEPIRDRGWGDWSTLRNNYLISDFLRDAENQELVKSVHVQANYNPDDPVGETAWLCEIADQPNSRGFPHAIIGYANFGDSNVLSTLEGHARYQKVRGIRQVLNRHPDPRLNRAEHDWLNISEWRKRIGLLRRWNWTFDVQVYYHQMADVAALARQYDDIQFVLDHAGMLTHRDDHSLYAWTAAMQMLSRCPNITVKLSGYGMTNSSWTKETLRPLILGPIEWFGPDRVMFGSNFPVDRLMSNYDEIWETYKDLTNNFTPNERDLMFRGTAERVYGI